MIACNKISYISSNKNIAYATKLLARNYITNLKMLFSHPVEKLQVISFAFLCQNSLHEAKAGLESLQYDKLFCM